MASWAAVCRFGGIGDNLIASSVLPLLQQKYGNVEVLSTAPQASVFENNPYVSKLTLKKLDGLSFNEWQQWFNDRATEYEFFVNLSHTCENSLAFGPYQHQFWWPQKFRQQLANKNYLEFVHDLCDVPHKFAPAFYPTEAEMQQALATKEKVGTKVIAWCLSGSRLDKVYPYAPMAIARLIRELDMPVILLGAPGKDFDMAKIILEQVTRQNGSHENLHLALSPDAEKPSWPIRRILATAQTCDLIIGPDTGTMWSVAMQQMPKIVMLSHASPENITKHWCNTTTLHANKARVPCWSCHRLHETIDTCTPNKEKNGAACISDISVETIVKTATHLLFN